MSFIRTEKTLLLPREDWQTSDEDTTSSLSSDEESFDPDCPFTQSGRIDTTRKTEVEIPQLNLECLTRYEAKSYLDTAKTSEEPSSGDETSSRKQRQTTPRYRRFSVSGEYFTKEKRDKISTPYTEKRTSIKIKNKFLTINYKNKAPKTVDLAHFSLSDNSLYNEKGALWNLRKSSKSTDVLQIKKTLTINTSPPKTIQLPLFRKEPLTGKTFFKLFKENGGLKIALVIYKQPRKNAIFHLKEFRKLKKSNEQLKNIQTIQYFSLKSLEQSSFEHLKKWQENLKSCFN